MALKVAIIGLADTSRHLVPRSTSWSPWCLAWDVEFRNIADRTFELHTKTDIAKDAAPDYMERLRELADFGRLYLMPGMDAPYVEGSRPFRSAEYYPLQPVIASLGIDYFSSSIAYMLALAIHEKAEEIALYGVECDPGSEYEYQKANMEYLIGLARGRGIKVHLPEGCPLCRYTNPKGFEYVGGYGRVA